MKKNLTRDQYIDRLSDYAGTNLWNNERFGGEVDEFDYFFKQLAREREAEKKLSKKTLKKPVDNLTLLEYIKTMKVKTTTHVEFEADRQVTASGNKEYWTFRLVSNRYLTDASVETFCSMHGCGGQDMTFTSNKTLLGYVYEGTATCYCD